MSREAHVRFCEGLGVKFPRPTHPYIWTAEGWLYVAVVLDLFSRRIVGWSMQASMTSQLVADALMMAVWRRGRPQELLHHSDRGGPIRLNTELISISGTRSVKLPVESPAAMRSRTHPGSWRRARSADGGCCRTQ